MFNSNNFINKKFNLLSYNLNNKVANIMMRIFQKKILKYCQKYNINNI